MKICLVLYLVALWSTNNQVSSFTSATLSTPPPTKSATTFLSAATSTTNDNNAEEEASSMPLTRTIEVVQKVAVAGATGRTGRLVVQELLDRQVPVVAMVRSMDKAKETFPDKVDNLDIVPCDLTSETAIASALKGCDAVIWCATGFSDTSETNLLEQVKRLLGVAPAPKQSIDAVGIPLIAKSMLKNQQVAAGKTKTNSDDSNVPNEFPKVVMLSSAGCTRPQWDQAKKEEFRGCADIPIVRLNPFGILDIKAESEETLRGTGKCIRVLAKTAYY
jgi:NADPH:quinone reductase-like Zn-dependent oxidoreductase